MESRTWWADVVVVEDALEMCQEYVLLVAFTRAQGRICLYEDFLMRSMVTCRVKFSAAKVGRVSRRQRGCKWLCGCVVVDMAP